MGLWVFKIASQPEKARLVMLPLWIGFVVTSYVINKKNWLQSILHIFKSFYFLLFDIFTRYTLGIIPLFVTALRPV